jgi:hypothetical protein
MSSSFPFSRGWMMAAVALATVPFAQAGVERVVEKAFAVSSVGTVNIETSGGDIRVEASTDATTVRVVATQRFTTRSEREADEIAKASTLTIEQTGSDIRAKASRVGTNSWSWRDIFSWGQRRSVRVDFLVTVPAAFAAQLKTSGGDIIVGDMNGAVRATTSGGDVSLGHLGSAVEARTSGGDISLKQASGVVKLNTSGGDIKAGRLSGDATLSTSGGDIEVERVEGRLSAHTSGGDVSAEFGDTLTGDSSLGTSGGDVSVVLGRAAAFHLDARTSGGKVSDSGLEISNTERRKNRISGVVNGGGDRLRLHSSGGDITVRAR